MHRVAQFFRHLTARVSSQETAQAREILPPRAWPLFEHMPVADRRHALDVMARLRAHGLDDQELLAAALLHDAAKGSRTRLWHRVGGVLLDALAPGLLRKIGSPDPESWRHGLYLYVHHERLSADAALAAGCSPRTAAFIRGDVTGESETDARLSAALHAADEAS